MSFSLASYSFSISCVVFCFFQNANGSGFNFLILVMEELIFNLIVCTIAKTDEFNKDQTR